MDYSVDDLYTAISVGETGSEQDPWIRTRQQVTGGSNAYGPVQMLSSYASQMPVFRDTGLPMIDFSTEELDYIKRFKQQGSLFYKYGGADMVKGKEHYDYGGKGDLWSDQDKVLYESVAKKFMQYEYNRVGKDIDKFIEAWRGKSEAETIGLGDDYYNHVKSSLPKDTSNKSFMNQVINGILSKEVFE
tara:strand:- start:864 stop:1427 length:564 start_codon:yes stop_codon:yes gene_type:complete